MFDMEYLKSQTVLFVEDEELAREILANMLSKVFKKVLTAANGLEGLEKFEESKSSNEIDLIISDINMPIMNGLDMLEKIREIDSTIPVIFVTARNETNNILRAIDLNVTNYIIKPVQMDIMLSKIKEACEKKYIRKQLDEKKEELENLNLTDLMHSDIQKDAIDKTWEFIRKGEVWSGNTKFITKEKEVFYLKNTIFKIKINSKFEYITIGFSTTKESTEKREFQKKVVKSIQEFNKREYSYKKLITELNDNIKQLESYIPRLQQEVEDQKVKAMSKHRQLEHYEMQMHNVDEKYYGHMTVKSKEVDEYSRIILGLKQEKNTLIEKNKDAQYEIEATKKELALLTKIGEQKNKRIDDLKDVIRSLESKLKDLTNL